MGKPVVLGTQLPRVQRGEGPRVGKAILSVSMPSGRIEEVGRKIERKNVLYRRLSIYKQIRSKKGWGCPFTHKIQVMI